MAQVIWKFPLRPGLNQLEMPNGATLLKVVVVADEPFLYASVITAARKELRPIFVLATGQEFPPEHGRGFFYVDSFKVNEVSVRSRTPAMEALMPMGIDGEPVQALVYHVFDATEF